MNFKKMTGWFFEFSEKVLAYLINTIYAIILSSPLVLVDFMFKESIFRLPLFFIPLAALYLIALKCITYSWYMIFIRQKTYYKGYFFKSLKDKFLSVFFYYLISVGFLYMGLNSTYILIITVNNWFWILFALIVILIVPNIIYTTLQFALYEENSLMETVKNSMILSLMYGIITIALTLVFVWLVYSFRTHPFRVVALGIPGFAGALILVQRLISDNQKKKKVEK